MAQTILTTGSITRAYKAGREMAGGPAAPAALPPAQSDGPSFAEMVSQAGAEAVQTMRSGDAAGRAGLAGKADPQQVVEATLAMETTLKTVVSVRDKLVSAYQEVLRMPI